jgi:hypothetical protein
MGVAVGCVAAVLALAPLGTLATATRGIISNNNATGARYAALIPAFRAEQDCLGEPVVVMTRNPWELTEATGIPSVQIPNDSLDTVLAVARRYHVTDIELNDGRSALRDRKSLLAPDGPLVRSSVAFTGHPIYRIKSETRTATC